MLGAGRPRRRAAVGRRKARPPLDPATRGTNGDGARLRGAAPGFSSAAGAARQWRALSALRLPSFLGRPRDGLS